MSDREGARQVSEAAGKERGIRERATQTSTTDAEGKCGGSVGVWMEMMEDAANGGDRNEVAVYGDGVSSMYERNIPGKFRH